MAGSISNFLEDELLDHSVGTGSWSTPATAYIALFTDDPTDADTGTEVSGGSYARQSMAFDAASGGACDNTSDVTFPEATASWGTVTHWGIYDADTAGNLLWHGDFDASKEIGSGDTAKVAAGDLDLTLD